MQAELALNISKRATRIAVSVYFFLAGLCFSSWASRIPNIQQTLQLSEAELGSILLSLPFLNIASQKNFISIYHMCVYGDKDLHDWFVSEYNKQSKVKLDMGKSCIRFKKPEQVPLKLIGELASKVTPQQWIERYQKMIDSRQR